ncbi:MAG: asparagine synthase (glutamine-hydrolyzing) [Gammaproteobacteria bacterium]
MCGIAGILKFDAYDAVEYPRLKQMRDVLFHRGPDDGGIIIRGRAGLGHRRLSIIDIRSGQQPMTNGDQNLWITYNGEIYNFRELRAELMQHGCSFSTQSDTEVILHAYRVFGEECVQHLRGMFAFAIWDRQGQRLFLARDRLGIKPLYYTVTDRELLFGSEIKAILAAGNVRPALNKEILPEYLATRFVAGSETFYQGIRKLLPGSTLTWTPEGGFRKHRYWKLPENLDHDTATIEERAREVRALLEDAVQSHLVSDVPLGLFLSGGIDSSGLAAMMAPMMNGRLQTFSVGFAEQNFNELPYARLAAQVVGAEHREVTVTAMDFFKALPKLLWHEDEPIAFSSSICLYFVSRLASEYVKVVMTGEGADELFLGYNRYRVTAWNERLGKPYWAVVPRPMREEVSRLIQHFPRSLRRYAERSFLGPAPGVRGLFYENFAVFPQFRQKLLLAHEFSGDPYAEGLRYYNEAPGDALGRMSYADMQTYLVELLMKQDQMSMAASIESRVPFLDHKLVERVAAMPSRYKLRGWQTKAVLKEAFRNLVPKEILLRKKMGFPVPLARWFRGAYGPMMQELVVGKRTSARDLFNPEYLRCMVEEHRSGEADHSERLWMLMNLEIWQRIFVDGESPEAVTDQFMRRVDLSAAA